MWLSPIITYSALLTELKNFYQIVGNNLVTTKMGEKETAKD